MQKYPQSDDVKIQFIVEMIYQQINEAEVDFIIEGTEILKEEVAGHFGCLNLLMIEVKEYYDKIMQQKFTIKDFEEMNFKLQNKDTESIINGINKLNEKKQFPIIFTEDEDAYFNCVPYFDDNFSFAIVIHFIHFSIEELINFYKKNPKLLVNGRISLDNIYNKWKKAVENNEITLFEKAEIQKRKGLLGNKT